MTATDTHDAGNGKMEIRALVYGKVAKSIVANFHVNESITPPTEEVPAGADWVNRVLEELEASKAEVLIVKSSTEGSSKRFRITVDDDGVLSAIEVSE